jgi:hypothetical protein
LRHKIPSQLACVARWPESIPIIVGVQKVAARGKGVVTWHGEKSINEGPLIATHHTRRNLMENDEEMHTEGEHSRRDLDSYFSVLFTMDSKKPSSSIRASVYDRDMCDVLIALRAAKADYVSDWAEPHVQHHTPRRHGRPSNHPPTCSQSPPHELS